MRIKPNMVISTIVLIGAAIGLVATGWVMRGEWDKRK